MSESRSDKDMNLTSVELAQTIHNAELSFLPEKSGEKCLKAYDLFKTWIHSKRRESVFEDCNAVILHRTFIFFSVPVSVLADSDRSVTTLNNFKRHKRYDDYDYGWSWTYVDMFGTNTYEPPNRQEIKKPSETVNVSSENIDISPEILHAIFSKPINKTSINLPKKIVNNSPETVNISPSGVIYISPQNENVSQKYADILPETINNFKSKVNSSPEMGDIYPVITSKGPEEKQFFQNSELTTEVPKTNAPNEQQLTRELLKTAVEEMKIQMTTTETPETTTEENPCNRPDPELPDFSAPGRRISEIKCYEYIWRIKEREMKKKNRQDCRAYRRKHGNKWQSGNGGYGYGGRPAKPGEFPHMGAIGWKSAEDENWEFKCGGTLISPKFILTAAHCTRASKLDTTVADPVPKIVRLHDIKIINPGGVSKGGGYNNKRDVNISRIIPHPKYKSPLKYYDIALLELEVEVDFDLYMQPACLWTKHDTRELGTEAMVTGWGVTETSRSTSPILMAVMLDLIDFQQCDNLLEPLRNRHFSGLEDHQICAGKLAGGADACQGDSGGPLQVKIPLPESDEGKMHYVVGITSFGFGCALANKPGVYTRVSTFVDWVEDIVWH